MVNAGGPCRWDQHSRFRAGTTPWASPSFRPSAVASGPLRRPTPVQIVRQTPDLHGTHLSVDSADLALAPLEGDGPGAIEWGCDRHQNSRCEQRQGQTCGRVASLGGVGPRTRPQAVELAGHPANSVMVPWFDNHPRTGTVDRASPAGSRRRRGEGGEDDADLIPATSSPRAFQPEGAIWRARGTGPRLCLTDTAPGDDLGINDHVPTMPSRSVQMKPRDGDTCDCPHAPTLTVGGGADQSR